MNPWFVTGFWDAEGCFNIITYRNNKMKIGWLVAPRFSIILHERDKPLLEQIKNFFGVGCIIKSGSKSIQFQVVSVKDFRVIIDHFDKYPLITEKCSNFKLFKKLFQLKPLWIGVYLKS